MHRQNQYRISKQRYAEFLEHYAWQLLKSPDYRLGQAFINYFNEIDKIMEADGMHGQRDAVSLYYEKNNVREQETINLWLDH
jgi:hypothetical protein